MSSKFYTNIESIDYNKPHSSIMTPNIKTSDLYGFLFGIGRWFFNDSHCSGEMYTPFAFRLVLIRSKFDGAIEVNGSATLTVP